MIYCKHFRACLTQNANFMGAFWGRGTVVCFNVNDLWKIHDKWRKEDTIEFVTLLLLGEDRQKWHAIGSLILFNQVDPLFSTDFNL